MRFESLDVTNIKCFSHFAVDFSPGINFICGKNGAGKTTLVESIGLAFFGAGAEEKKYLDYFLRDGARSGAIHLTFSVGAETYTIQRRLKRNASSRRVLDRAGNELDLHGEQDIEEFLKEILGIEGKQSLARLFQEVIGVRQGMLTQPFREAPAERKRIFNAMLGVERYKQAAAALPELNNLIQQKAEATRLEFALHRSHTQDLESQREALLQAQRHLQQAQSARSQLQAACSQQEKELETLLSRQQKLLQLETQLTQAKAQYQARLQAWQTRQAQDSQALEEAKAEQTRVQAQLQSCALEETTCRQALEAASQAATAWHDSLAQQEEAYTTQLNQLGRRQAAYQARLQQLEETSARAQGERCPYLDIPCTSVASLEEALAAQRRKFQSTEAAATQQIRALRQERNAFAREGAEKTAALEKQEQAGRASLEAALRRQSALEAAWKASEQTLARLTASLAQLEQQHAQFAQQLQELDQLEAACRQAGEGIDQDFVERARKSLTQLHQQAGEASARATALEQEALRLSQEVTRKEALLQEQRQLEQSLCFLERMNGVYGDVAALLRNAGERIATAYREQLSDLAQGLYRGISGDGARLVWGEDYDVQLVDTHQGEARIRSFRQLSGGEQMSVALSLRLALLQRLSPAGVAFFDEPTANLDATRREALAALLPRVTRSFEQVFLISHDDTFDAMSDNILEL